MPTLCERGHADQMVLSHDASCHIDWLPKEAFDVMPRWHYLHITQDVLPALKERGVTDEQIKQMMVDNPQEGLRAPGRVLSRIVEEERLVEDFREPRQATLELGTVGRGGRARHREPHHARQARPARAR